MNQDPEEERAIVQSVTTGDSASAIYINGKLVQKYHHTSAQHVAVKPLRIVKFRNPDALLGPKLKVQRAKKHIAELEALLTSFVQSQPYTLIVDAAPQTGEQVWRVEVHKEIPVEISVIIGDAVHNLRAALDYIVCDLVRAHNATITERQRDPAMTSAGFPVDAKAKRHKPGTIGKIKGIKPDAERLILRLKAHKGWNRQAWLLHFLDIRDKHNLIVTVAAATVQLSVQAAMPMFFQGPDGSLRIGGPGPGGKPILTAPGIPSTYRRVFPMKHHSEIHRTSPHIQESIDVTAEIAFGEGEIAEGETVLVTLKQCLELTERTIAMFERFA